MFLKLSLKFGILAVEIVLAFYSFILTDSLLVKFLFFSFSAFIIAFLVAKLASQLLPPDKDTVSDPEFLTEEERRR